PGTVLAQDEAPMDSGGGGEASGSLFGMSAAFSGFVRLEAAYRLSDKENPNNLQGNPFNMRPTGRMANLPFKDQFGTPGAELPFGLGQVTGPVLDLLQDTLDALAPGIGIPTRATRNTKRANNDWSLQQLRGKFDMNLQISPDLQMYASL